jgi:fermentation-respiration switch protein FrsA (DUF1100 family)
MVAKRALLIYSHFYRVQYVKILAMKKFGFISVILIGLYMSLFQNFEKQNLYFPTAVLEGTPKDIGLSFEDIYLKTEDGVKINAWFIPHKNSRYALLHCHGNAGNISHRLHDIQRFHQLGMNVLVFDYRGYGKSEGSPTETGTYLDAQVAYQHLLNEKEFKEKEIILFGESLGGAVAIDLCTKVNPAGLICLSTFTSTEAIAKEIYPFIPVKLFISYKYDSLSKIVTISIPKLFLHSQQDEIVPFHHGQKLFEAAKEPKDFFEMQGGHNDGFLITKGYDEALKKFLYSVFKDRSIL